MIKKGLLAGLIILFLGISFNFLLELFIPALANEYKNPNLMRPWTDPLMMIFFAYPFVLGLVSAYFWNLIEKNFIGGTMKKAFQFAKSYFIIATIPGMFISYTTFQISLLMVFSWTVLGFLEVFLAGVIFAKAKNN